MKGQLLPDANAGPEGWSSRDKLAAVIETASMNAADLGEYCRRRCICPDQFRVWRDACERANDWERTATTRITRETKNDKKRIKDLERDLARKKKTLAEAAALIILGKRPRPSGPRRREQMTSTPDRRDIVALIDKAMAAGAPPGRLPPAPGLA